MSKKVRNQHAPVITEEFGDYTPVRSGIPPARQLCHGSSRVVESRPKLDQCPICERNVDIKEVSTRRLDPVSQETIYQYEIPSHLMKRQV